MSLIHEALRKARHEAARGDDPGVIYPGGLTGRRRRGLAVGIFAGIVLTIALATIIGGTLWWVVRQRPSDEPAGAGPGQSTAQPMPPEAQAYAPADEILIEEPALSAAAEPHFGADGEPSETEPAGIATDPDITERHRPNSEPADRTVTFATQPTRAPDPSAANREYVADADLGYANLSLDYIVFRPNDPFAQINGFDVRVGSHIEGFAVEEITADAVHLRDARGPLVLRAE